VGEVIEVISQDCLEPFEVKSFAREKYLINSTRKAFLLKVWTFLRKMEFVSHTFIVSPPVYSHTAFLDDFFWRSLPYTEAETTPRWRTGGASAPVSKETSCSGTQQAPASSGVCQTFVVCDKGHREIKGEEMSWLQARNLFHYPNASPLRVLRTYDQCRG
jgi:hypothetical protein